MAAAWGLWNHNLAAQQMRAQAQAGAPAAPADEPSDSGSDSATISANDFLTLLVTEMQNQDPTEASDPNQYINQLVQVNSLEQLISINQTVSAALGGTSSSSGDAEPGGKTDSMRTMADSVGSASSHRVASAPGNLSIPPTHGAAQRVAQALDGRHSRQQ